MTQRVAIIGAGPGGIVAAKFLLQEGLEPVVFEQSDQPGGQWHVRNPLSGIWPGMPTNTSRIMTQFSDLEHSPGLPDFPAAEQIHDYLNRYVDEFGIRACLRLESPVVSLRRDSALNWQVGYRRGSSATRHETFDRVLLACGRFNQPYFPEVAGLRQAREPGGLEVLHSHAYSGPGEFRGKKVLVAGGAISALEIASDLALHGAASVSCAYRNQRYVLGKLARGVPTDHINFSLYEALAAERLDGAVNARLMREWVLREFGNPQDFGAPCPDEDLRKAGTTKCAHFLGLVAEQRIRVHPWLQQIDGRAVQFADGSHEHFDAIIFATGYQLDFPFLGNDEARMLQLTPQQLGLYQHTFHPGLPGFAMAGFYNQVGPYFPVLELQARWIACVWSQRIAAPDEDEMRRGLQAYLDSWSPAQKLPMHQLAMMFARAIGAEPDPAEWPEIERALWFGPLCAAVFRLGGPNPLDRAAQLVARHAAEFGMIDSPRFTPLEQERLAGIAV